MLGRYVLVLEDLAVELTQPLLKTSLRRLANRSDVPVEEGRVIAENYGAVALLIDRQALAGAGGPELDRDDLWDRYCKGALYAYVAY